MKREDKLYKLGKEFKKNYVQVCSVLNVIDQYIISSLMKKNVKAMVKLTILTHEQKLRNLTQTLYTPTDTVLNLSSQKLTDEEMNVLRYGLKHSIEPNLIHRTGILSTFDFIHRTMSKNLKDQKDTGEVKVKILYFANNYVNSYKPTKNALRKT